MPRYEIVDDLGEGGEGKVRLATNGLVKYALKEVRDDAVSGGAPADSSSQEAIQRLRREAENLSKVGEHPNVVRVHEVTQTSMVIKGRRLWSWSTLMVRRSRIIS